MKSTALFYSTLLTSLLVCSSTVAQTEYPYYKPQLTNSKDGSVHDFPLGVLSATGRLRHGNTAILVKHVGQGGPAEQGDIREGDLIVAIDGKRMPPYSKEVDAGLQGPQALLAMSLEKGCSLDDPKLKLTLARNNEPVQVEIALPPAPRYAKTFPVKCEKTQAYRSATCQWLVEQQRSDGSWPGGIGGDDRDYQGSLCLLALLSAGDQECLPNIERAVKFLRSHEITKIVPGNPKEGPKNWIAAAVAIALSEYYLATEDQSVLPDIQKCCDLLAARVASNGRMGHHFEITYGGGGLTIINAHAHLAWALAANCGCSINGAAWNRSMGEVGKAISKSGALGYSSAAVGDDDAPARTGAMAAALVISRQQPSAAIRMGRWLLLRNNRMRNAHTNCSMGLIFGTAGVKMANPGQLKGHLNNWLPYLELSRGASGAASYFGSKRNFGGDEYLGLAALANATVTLMLASPESNLFMFGGSKKGWLNHVAEQEIAQDEATPSRKPSPPKTDRKNASAYRTWTSNSGRFQIEARLLKVDGDTVYLRSRSNGREFSVPIERLSIDDRKFIRKNE